MKNKILVIAGEASGDLHGANLIRELQALGGNKIEIYGVGGQRVRETGAKGFFDLAHFHVTGFTEVIKKIPSYKKAEAHILELARSEKPDAAILIDNPGFNLHLARTLHRMGIPLFYYISPQIWAWAPQRVQKIKKTIRKMLVVFEFEKKLYENHGIPVSWVGHPLKDVIPHKNKPVLKNRIVALMPGSRKSEVKNLCPILLETAKKIREKEKVDFFLIQSPTLSREFYEPFFKKTGFFVPLVRDNAYEVIRESELVLVCSGTATLECALLGTPMIITNRGSFLTYLIVKNLIRVPYLGLPNLILDEKKMPEFLQYEAKPEKIAEEALLILKNPERKTDMKKALERVSEKLGPPGASRRAAEEILKEFDEMGFFVFVPHPKRR
ncbi:MAG: lipid-A-disaccharide synthase, partial [Candidatus Omnitrophica bacterium]|nr:lipid-A-disaccharide synthase [Candidatus Omnitrophota bacterium]